MKIISPGIKEGILYRRTALWVPSNTLSMRKDCYRLLNEVENNPVDEWYMELHGCHYSWMVAYKDPHEREDWRRNRVYPYIKKEDLDAAVDEAAAVFARDAIIKTLEKPRFDQEWSDRIREYPVSEGVLQYFRKEIKKRRQKLIEEID